MPFVLFVKETNHQALTFLNPFKNAVLLKGFYQVPILRHIHAKYIRSSKTNLLSCSTIY